jgi:Ring finger domain
MSVSFHNAPFNGKTSCGICLEGIKQKNGAVVAHNKGGEKHPMHTLCLKTWLKKNDLCPMCNKSCDKDSLFSLKERVIIKLHPLQSLGKSMGLALITTGIIGAVVSGSGYPAEAVEAAIKIVGITSIAFALIWEFTRSNRR